MLFFCSLRLSLQNTALHLEPENCALCDVCSYKRIPIQRMDRHVIRRFLSFTNRIQAAAENQKVLINALMFCSCQLEHTFEQSGYLHTLFLPFWNK